MFQLLVWSCAVFEILATFGKLVVKLITNEGSSLNVEYISSRTFDSLSCFMHCGLLVLMFSSISLWTGLNESNSFYYEKGASGCPYTCVYLCLILLQLD